MAAKLHGEQLQGFLGVNLRRDRLSLADSDCARAINADFHTQPGTARIRPGITSVRTGIPGAVTLVTRQNSQQYLMADGRWYRNGTDLGVILTPGNGSTVGFRPVDDPQSWTFLANITGMYKDRGVLRQWGTAAPNTPPALFGGSAGVLLGNYSLRYTYLRKDGTAVAYESNPSEVSNTLGVTNTTILVTNLVDSADAQITHKRLYRTVNTGSTWLNEADIAQGTTTATLTLADDELGETLEEDNDPPPLAGIAIEFEGHIFLAGDVVNPHYVWYSKRFRPESFPAANFIEIGYPGDPIRSLVRLVGLLGVITRDTKYRVVGNDASGFVAIEALSSRGTPAGHAALVTDQGALFVASDGLFLTNFQSADVGLTGEIESLFYRQTVNDFLPIDWSRASEMALAAYKQRYYFSYPTTDGRTLMAVYSRETQKWYFYDLAVQCLFADEVSDTLWGGTDWGEVIGIDSYTSSTEDIRMQLTFADRGGPALNVRKRYLYMTIDADAGNGAIPCNLVVDGNPRYSFTIRGRRKRTLVRLPDRMLGYTWRLTVDTLSREAQAIYGVAMMGIPLQVA